MDSSRNNFDNTDSSTNAIIISWARENAKYFLKSVIDLEAENWDNVNPQTWKIATHNIVKRLKDSADMDALISNLRRRINTYSGSTCVKIGNNAEPIPIYSVKPNIPPAYLGLSYWNKTTMDVLRPKHLKQLAEDIAPQQPLGTRLLAFKMLLNTQLADAASSDCWGLLQQNLVESLCDDDDNIFSMSLKVHAKLLTISDNIMKEGFVGLIDGLRSHYSRKFNKNLPVLEQGLELDKPVHHRLIKISHLVLETTRVMTENWAKMGEQYVEEIMTVFLAVISMHTYDSMYSKNILYPFHIVASLDPTAKWCRQWVHCLFGRSIFLSLQPRVVTLLRYIIEEMSLYLESTVAEIKPLQPGNLICKETIRLAIFSHCVNIFCCITAYKMGHSFFPLTCRIKKDMTLPEIFCKFIEYLNTEALNLFKVKVISNAMARLVQTKECPLLSLCEVFKMCLRPMENVSNVIKDSHHNVPWHSIIIVEALSKNESGVMFLVEGKSNVEYEMESPWSSKDHNNLVTISYPVNIIMNYADYLLRHKCSNKEATISLLESCAMFFKYYDFCSTSSHIPLIETAIAVFEHIQLQCKDLFYTNAEGVFMDLEELLKPLVHFLSNVANHASGVLTIMQYGHVMENLIPSLFECTAVTWENAHFRRLVTMLTTLQQLEDVMISECRKPINEALCNLWTILEDEEYFISGIEHNIKRAVKQYMNIVNAFTCTLSGTKVFYAEYENSEETLMDPDCNPSSPAELIMIDSSNETVHKIALLTLQALTRNLDAWLYIEAKFNIEKHLFQVQMDNISSPLFESILQGDNDCEKKIIVDECSQLRHQILFNSHIISRSSDDLSGVNSDIMNSFTANFSYKQTTKLVTRDHDLETKCGLQNLLEDSEGVMNNTNWIASARKAFSSTRNVKPNLIVTLVEYVALHNSNIQTVLDWDNVQIDVNNTLCAEEILGIQISVRHGVRIDVLERDLSYDHLLRELIEHTRVVLKMERDLANFRGFDWFLSSVFLLCAGNLEMSQCFLDNFVKLHVSLVLWPTLAKAKSIQCSCLLFSSLVDLVISKNVPLATGALQLTGISWGILCYNWMCQCFWNILEWNQVCQWLTLCILYPPDITVYFCAALLLHLEPKLLKTAFDEYSWDQIVHENFNGFCITEQMMFLDTLIKQHRPVVLPKLLQAITAL